MSELEVVGVRFRPTEEEIISYYLERKMAGLDFPVQYINEVDVLRYEPWDLPDLSARPDKKMWYFFNAPTYKYANSKRTNRTTRAGYWKVTGKDRAIWDDRGTKVIGMKKNLVFYTGRIPNGVKTNWVIHEYHSNNAPLYQKEFVLWRLKRKSSNESNSYNIPMELPSRSSASDSGNDVTEITVPQVNYDRPVELDLRNYTRDHNPLSATELAMPRQQGPSYSNWPMNEFGAIEQDHDFFNSLLAAKDGYWEKTLIHDKDNETIYEESGPFLETPSLFDMSTSSREYRQMQLVRAPTGTPSFSNRDSPKSVNSSADNPQINCIQLVCDEFPISKRNYKVQQLPKSRDSIEEECSPRILQLQGKISRKGVSECSPRIPQLQGKISLEGVSKNEGKEAAEDTLDLPWKENSIVKFGKDQKKAQTINAKTSLKFRSNLQSDGIKRNGSLISLETSSLGYKTISPSVYILNVVVAVILLVFFVWATGSLH